MTGELFYIFVNQVSEREREREGPQAHHLRRNPIWLLWPWLLVVFCGDLCIIFFFNSPSGPGAGLLTGYWAQWVLRAHTQVQTMARDRGVGKRWWACCPRHIVRVFRNLPNLQARGHPGAWLYFMGSVSVTHFIKLSLPFLQRSQGFLAGSRSQD